jgi:hypothetical protein
MISLLLYQLPLVLGILLSIISSYQDYKAKKSWAKTLAVILIFSFVPILNFVQMIALIFCLSEF